MQGLRKSGKNKGTLKKGYKWGKSGRPVKAKAKPKGKPKRRRRKR